jgi:hypothetical protein
MRDREFHLRKVCHARHQNGHHHSSPTRATSLSVVSSAITSPRSFAISMVDSVDWMKVSLIRSIPSLPMMGRGQFSVRDFEAIGWRATGGCRERELPGAIAGRMWMAGERRRGQRSIYGGAIRIFCNSVRISNFQNPNRRENRIWDGRPQGNS